MSTLQFPANHEIGGPMNAQAEALAARTKLLYTEVLEALRRSYAEAGYSVGAAIGLRLG